MFMLGLVLLIGLPIYLLLFDNPGWSDAPNPLTIGELRAAAAVLPGSAPSAVEVEVVASRRLPQALYAAGSGFQLRRIMVKAYRLPVPGAGAIMIDSGLTRAEAERLGMYFDALAQARVDRALTGAKLILVTHEHGDHMSGLAALAGRTPNGPNVLARAMLNPAQAAPARFKGAVRWPEPTRPVARLAARGLQPVAPGVVVVPAPGHTPGSQMIFVRTVSGAEYLFTGDTASISESWRRLRLRSRLLGAMTSPEHLPQVHAWLRTIRKLRGEAPGLVIVTGHDFTSLRRFADAAVTDLPAVAPATKLRAGK